MILLRLLVVLGLMVGRSFAQNDTLVTDSTELITDMDVIRPEPLNQKEVSRKIIYPPKLKEAGLGGKVYFRMLIDSTGKVLQIRTLRSSHPDFEAAVLPHLKDLKFRPALSNKTAKPVKSWVVMPFSFKSDKPAKPTFIDPNGLISFGVEGVEGLNGRKLLKYNYPKAYNGLGSFIFQLNVDNKGKVISVIKKFSPVDAQDKHIKAIEKTLLKWQFSTSDLPKQMLWVNLNFSTYRKP